MQKLDAGEIQSWLISRVSGMLGESPSDIGTREAFKDFGLSSVQSASLAGDLESLIGRPLPATLLFDYPTIESVVQFLCHEKKQAESAGPVSHAGMENEPIAITGIGCRFPGAKGTDEFWQFLRDGRDAITEVPPDRWNKQRFYDSDPATPGRMNTKCGGFLEHVGEFDSHAFGISPREAERMDPQQRLLMETTWEALENSGMSPEVLAGSQTGVFIAISGSDYSRFQYSDPQLMDAYATTGNAISIAANRLSYFFDLHGPSVALDTACSSSLVALHMACQSIRNKDCDMAITGAVNLILHPEITIAFTKAGVISAHGCCRTFDAKADGYVRGEGVGVVVLKPLSRALHDRDRIYAVIRGSAVNQDGKTNGITAPSGQAQQAMLREACHRAGIQPRELQYVETHGSGTILGDPIEAMALGAVVGQGRPAGDFCSIGSVKASIGHLEAAAGMASLIKVALSLHHEAIPPSLHFQEPNPHIDFNKLQLRVQQKLESWPRGERRRLAGISSFGFGGTNCHVVVEEGRLLEASGPMRPVQLLTLSAKTEPALEAATSRLADYLRQDPNANLGDLAYTLHKGRGAYDYRRMMVSGSLEEARGTLEKCDPGRVFTGLREPDEPKVVFMFPGVGEHYVHMAAELYRNERSFQTTFNQCSEVVEKLLGVSLKELVYPDQASVGAGVDVSGSNGFRKLLQSAPFDDEDDNSLALGKTSLIQPALFAVEYALATLLIQWGIKPEAMIGYSLGEYVAACVAGVLSLHDALFVVVKRGQMIEELRAGAMLAVSLSPDQLFPLLSPGLSIAAVNTPSVCVVSGEMEEVRELKACLTRDGIACRPLRTSHAFHSAMMDPILDRFTQLMRTIDIKAPQIPYISNVTGTWITAEEVKDPSYWARHLRQTVKFEQGARELFTDGRRILVELGPGQSLGSFVKQHPDCKGDITLQGLSVLPYRHTQQSALLSMLETVGKLWVAGKRIDWDAFHEDEKRQKLFLPSYPFERRHYWFPIANTAASVDGPDSSSQSTLAAISAPLQTLGELPREAMKNWFYLPGWKQVAPQRVEWEEEGGNGEEDSCWLLLMDETGLGREIAEELKRHKQRVVEVRAGTGWKKEGEGQYVIRAEAGEDYGAVLQEVQRQGWKAKRVVHLWTVGNGGEEEGVEEVLKKGMYSLLYLAQGLERQHLEGCEIAIVTTEMQGITAEERVCAEKGTLLGPCRIIPVEYQKMNCRCIDVKKVEGEEGRWDGEWVKKSLLRELVGKSQDRVVALRGHQRWVEVMEAVELWEEGKEEEGGEEREEEWMRRGGVYMVTGGLGGIGLGMAEYLAGKGQAKLVLVGRTGLPGREEWERVLEEERAAKERAAKEGEGKEGKKEKEEEEMETSVGSKIRRVKRMEELGGEVLVVAADVGKEEELRAGVREAVKRFGTVHGVIHAAGVPGIGLSQLKTPEMLKKVMGPKVEGTLVLEKVMKEEGIELDFLALFSSVASITGGGPGQFDYCAANAFLDGYAQREARRKWLGKGKRRRTVSIDWGEWQWNAWSEGLATVSEEIRRFFTEGRKKYGITFAEGQKALGRILRSSLPQVVVSTQDFRRVFEATKEFTAGIFDSKLETASVRSSRYRRPDLKTVFAVPGSKIEKLIGGIWEEFLGIAPIGIHDNFFELGGNSLIAIQIVARLRQVSGVDLPVSALLANPTITEMAVVTEFSIIEKIERMSEETAQNLMTASATAKN